MVEVILNRLQDILMFFTLCKAASVRIGFTSRAARGSNGWHTIMAITMNCNHICMLTLL